MKWRTEVLAFSNQDLVEGKGEGSFKFLASASGWTAVAFIYKGNSRGAAGSEKDQNMLVCGLEK